MRSSLGPGVGVGRGSTERGPPLEGRMAARCSVDIVKTVVETDLINKSGLGLVLDVKRGTSKKQRWDGHLKRLFRT